MVNNTKELLIVTRSNDTAINKICLWLNYYKVKYVRLNDELLRRSFHSIVLNNSREEINILYEGCVINLLKFDLIYFRRGYLQNSYYLNKLDFSEPNLFDLINEFLNVENESVTNYIINSLREKCINSSDKYNIDKLTGIKYAKLSGLNVPNTLLFNGKAILSSDNKYFSKPNSISPDILSNYKRKDYLIVAKHRVIENTNSLTHSNSLIQDYIDKKFELRIFYFLGKCYSVAIFSQLSNESKHDSRKTSQRLIRYIPYHLERKTMMKIQKFMNLMCLESGSIDMILTPSNEYIFLEVNPVGMFDYLGSWSGGICLEKLVAQEIVRKLSS
jgi:hypothetical protein